MNAPQGREELRFDIRICLLKQRIVRPHVTWQINERTAAKHIAIHQCRHLNHSGEWDRRVGDVSDVVVRKRAAQQNRHADDPEVFDAVEGINLPGGKLRTQPRGERTGNRYDHTVEPIDAAVREPDFDSSRNGCNLGCRGVHSQSNSGGAERIPERFEHPGIASGQVTELLLLQAGTPRSEHPPNRGPHKGRTR